MSADLSTEIRFKGTPNSIRVHLKSFSVSSPLPGALKRLLELAKKNIAWSWNQNFLNELENLDPLAWQKADHNILIFLESLSLQAIDRATKQKSFMDAVETVTAQLEAFIQNPVKPEMAYFCMEYGIASCLRIYSGGLGVLAGDHLKTASDLRMPLCAVGLAYKHGYFSQRISMRGEQFVQATHNDFSRWPVEAVKDGAGQDLKIRIPFPGREVVIKAWRVGVGAMSLLLLDSDCEENSDEDRRITDNLYGGDSAHRLKQEILLGIGGYRMLKALNIPLKAYHMNEGHAAFLVWARLIDLIQEKGLSLEESLDYVYETNVFTTHTPVPAGHDVFGDSLIAPYIELYAKELKSDVGKVASLGKLCAHNRDVFSMTDLALRGSCFVNGVSQIHGRVAREMFHEVFPGLHEKEIPVRGITNGVHLGTWLAQEWQDLYADKFGKDWNTRNHKPALKKLLEDMPAKKFWDTHLNLKRRMIQALKTHIRVSYPARGETPAQTAAAMAQLNERALFFGFARRFAPYKRATLLFHHLERLESLIQAGFPIVILYAGKAHPHDVPGQELIQKIIEISRRPSFAGRVLFLENYEMDMARLLVQGCDVWLNTPTRPLEASGTSGMKASINGCLNLSVADGWWAEAYNGKNGWLIAEENLDTSLEFQLEYDSAQIYSLLESEIVPMHFDRDANGLPLAWIDRMKESMISTTWDFSTARMLDDYERHFLNRARSNSGDLSSQAFAPLKNLTQAKHRMINSWEKISFGELKTEGLESTKTLKAGQSFFVGVDLDHPGLEAKELLVQALVTSVNAQGFMENFQAFDLTPAASGNKSTWSAQIAVDQAGPFSLGLRVLPRLELERSPQRVFMHLSKWY